jgi:catechol 2,3-dioxygenase-like lactoylglutathione lyase family enzyme
MRFAVDRLDHLVITCRDVEVSAGWYQRVLGMEREEFGTRDRRTALKFGGQKINLRPAGATQDAWFTGVAAAPGTQDLCFVVTMLPEQVVEHLNHCGVAIELGPVAKAGALGPIRSVYCRDPDGNLIEVASYGDAFGDG